VCNSDDAAFTSSKAVAPKKFTPSKAVAPKKSAARKGSPQQLTAGGEVPLPRKLEPGNGDQSTKHWLLPRVLQQQELRGPAPVPVMYVLCGPSNLFKSKLIEKSEKKCIHCYLPSFFRTRKELLVLTGHSFFVLKLLSLEK
jgi:hypothetical protein